MAAQNAVSGLVGGIYAQSGAAEAFTAEACTLGADGRTVSINDASLSILEYDKDKFTVYKDAGALTCDFEIAIGKIILAEAQTAGTFTMDGYIVPTVQIGSVFDWGLDIKRNVQDATVFTDTWEAKVAGIASWTGSFKKFWIDHDIFDILTAGNTPLVYRFFTDISNENNFCGYALMDGDKFSSKIDGMNSEEGNLIGHSVLSFHTSALD